MNENWFANHSGFESAVRRRKRKKARWRGRRKKRKKREKREGAPFTHHGCTR